MWEDPACLGTPKPVRHNYWACALEPGNLSYWGHVPQPLKPTHLRACAWQREKSLQWEALAPQLQSSHRSPQLEKACAETKTPAQTKINKIILTNYYRNYVLNYLNLSKFLNYLNLHISQTTGTYIWLTAYLTNQYLLSP